MTSILVLALVAVPLLAWWLYRDLQRAVARQEFEARFGQLRRDWESFTRAVGEALLPSMEQAARNLARIMRELGEATRR